MAKGLMQTLASLEELQEAQVEPITDVVEAAEVETELLDVQEDNQEIVEMSDDLETAEEAVDAMESLVAALESIQENGGMDKNTARMYDIARQSIYARMGDSASLGGEMSFEAFDSVSARQTATSISLEEEKGTIRKWAEAIWKFIRETTIKIIEWIRNLFISAKRTQKRLDNLKEAINKHDGAFEGKLSERQQASYGRRVVYTGAESKSLSDMVAEFVKFTTNVRGMNLPKATSDYVKAEIAAVRTGEEDVKEEVLESNLAKFIGTISKTLEHQNAGAFKKLANFFVAGAKKTGEFFGKSFEQAKGYSAGPSLGNYYVAVLTDEKTSFTIEAKALEEGKDSFKFTDAQLPRDKATASRIVDSISTVLKNQIAFNEEMDKLFKEFKTMTGDFQKAADKKDKPNVRKAVKGYRALFNAATKFNSSYSSYVVVQAKNVSDLVYIAMGKAKPADDKAEEKKD